MSRGLEKKVVFKLHARQRMVERNILHMEVVKTIKNGVKIDEYDRKRAIFEVEDGRYITCIYKEQRKAYVVITVYESGLTDVNIYKRMKK